MSVFGESDDLTHFIGKVRAIARTTQAAVLTMADVRIIATANNHIYLYLP